MWTGDGRVFFYNPSSRTSVWERPEDLLGRADVDKAISTTPEQLMTTTSKEDRPHVEIVMDPSAENASNISNSTATASRRRTDSESSGDDPVTTPSKKQKLESRN